MSTERAEINNILDQMPDELILAVKNFALATKKEYEQMKTKAYLASIPEDNEPVTNEDLKAFAEAEEDLKHGRTIPADQVWKKIGL